MAAIAAVACLFAATRLVSGEPAFQQLFNGPETTWQLLEPSTPARILSQECMPVGARDGSRSERIVVAARAGESVLLTCPTARVAVLSELKIKIWVKSNIPSIQLAARIALPRSRDPGSGAVTTAIVRGALYNRPGHWQQLTLSDIPKLLAAQLRVLRATPGVTIDSKEAYVDSIVLVVPGDPQGVELHTDDLEVDGILLTHTGQIKPASHSVVQQPAAAANASTAGTVRLQAGLLLVDDRPFVPRIIEWQGEPFAYLAERGFNAVRMPGPPTDEQIADAERHGVWFVSAAPRPEAISRAGIGRNGDRVFAWFLDDEAFEADANYSVRWAELIRQRDAVAGRPVVIAPAMDWSAASKSADVLAARHRQIHRVSAEDYDRWLERRPRFARHGIPLWADLATEFGEATRQQVAELSTTTLTAPIVEPSRLESLVRIAWTRGVRGFLFHSNSPLNDSDNLTRRRATALELINRRLQFVEPWVAAGKVIGRVASADAAWTGVVLHVDRARLLVPMATSEPADASVALDTATPSSSSEVTFLVPGVPESSQAYALSPVALRTLPLQRVAGGTRLVLPTPGDAVVLITEDPQVVHSLRQRIARDGPQIARLERELIAHRATLVTNNARRLKEIGYSDDDAARGEVFVEARLRQIDAQLAAGHPEQAYGLANSANQILEQLADQQRRRLSPLVAFDSNPLVLGDELLADYAAFRRSHETLRPGENLLYGGDFEDLGQMTQVGWRHFQQACPGIQSHVELSATEPKHGRYCLALDVASTGQESEAVDWAPVWVVSPPVPVDNEQIIEITGWLRIDAPLAGGGGLQIADSLGGPELSLAIRQTSDWQPFRMVRAVPESAELRLMFALAGIGSARVDAVMVRPLERPIARRLPPDITSPR